MSHVIVAAAATNQAPDQQHLVPLLEQIKQNLGRCPDVVTADTGYFSADGIAHHEDLGANLLIALERKRRQPAQSEKTTTSDNNESEARKVMRKKLDSDTGKLLYAERKWIVEPVFGNIKEARGFKRFSMRGIRKVRSEWYLLCLCHNLLKLVKSEGDNGLETSFFRQFWPLWVHFGVRTIIGRLKDLVLRSIAFAATSPQRAFLHS